MAGKLKWEKRRNETKRMLNRGTEPMDGPELFARPNHERERARQASLVHYLRTVPRSMSDEEVEAYVEQEAAGRVETNAWREGILNACED